MFIVETPTGVKIKRSQTDEGLITVEFELKEVFNKPIA